VAAGRYVVMDGDGNPVGVEDFRCAPGPAGWRYFSEVDTRLPDPHHETIDVAVDRDWRPVITRIATGEHEILLRSEPHRLTGYLDGRPVESPWGPDMHLDYLSPAFNAITANRLHGSAEIDVVYLEPVTCDPTIERQRYEDLGSMEVQTPVGTFEARRWHYTALSSGWTRDLWVAADVVVAYEGLFGLDSYEPGASGPRPLHHA
jgi:hypothetical protein